jgi:hypothetical protein
VQLEDALVEVAERLAGDGPVYGGSNWPPLREGQWFPKRPRSVGCGLGLGVDMDDLAGRVAAHHDVEEHRVLQRHRHLGHGARRVARRHPARPLTLHEDATAEETNQGTVGRSPRPFSMVMVVEGRLDGCPSSILRRRRRAATRKSDVLVLGRQVLERLRCASYSQP